MSDLALTTWVRDFCGSAVDVFDSVSLYDVFLLIDGRSGEDELQRPATDDVARLRNWKLIFKRIIRFYNESLHNIVIGPLPDLEALAFQPHSGAAQEALRILQLLLLGAAVQCNNRELHVGRIKQLPVDTQMDMMQHIQDVTATCRWQLSAHVDSTEEVSGEALLPALHRLAAERSRFHTKWLETSYLKNAQSAQSEQQLRRKCHQLTEEVDEKGRSLLAATHQVEVLRALLEKLKTEKESLQQDASAASFYRDELDALREKTVQFDRQEKDLKKFEKAARDLEHYQQRTKELEDENERLLCECSRTNESLASTKREKEHALRELIECRVELRESNSQVQELSDRLRVTHAFHVQDQLRVTHEFQVHDDQLRRRDVFSGESEQDYPTTAATADQMSLSEELQSSLQSSSTQRERLDSIAQKTNLKLLNSNLKKSMEMLADGLDREKEAFDQLRVRNAELTEKLEFYQQKETTTRGCQTLLDRIIIKKNVGVQSAVPKLVNSELQVALRAAIRDVGAQTENTGDEVDSAGIDWKSTGVHLQTPSHSPSNESLTLHQKFLAGVFDNSSSPSTDAGVQTGLSLAAAITETDLNRLEKILSTRLKSTGMQTEVRSHWLVAEQVRRQESIAATEHQEQYIYERPLTAGSIHAPFRRSGSLSSPLKSSQPVRKNVSVQTLQRVAAREEVECLQRDLARERQSHDELRERHQFSRQEVADQQATLRQLMDGFQVIERKLLHEEEVVTRYKEELAKSQRHAKELSAQVMAQELRQNQQNAMQSQVTASQIAELSKLLDSERATAHNLTQKIETVRREKLILEEEVQKNQFSLSQQWKELQTMKINFSKVESERDFQADEVKHIMEELSHWKSKHNNGSILVNNNNNNNSGRGNDDWSRAESSTEDMSNCQLSEHGSQRSLDCGLRYRTNGTEDQRQELSDASYKEVENTEEFIISNLKQQLKQERGRLNSVENKFEVTLHEKQKLILQLHSQVQQLQEEDEQRIRQIQSLEIQLERLKKLPQNEENWDIMINSFEGMAKRTSSRATQIDLTSADIALLQSELDGLRNEHFVLQETLLQVEKSCKKACRCIGVSASSFSQQSITVLVEQVTTLLIENVSQSREAQNGSPRNRTEGIATPQPGNGSRSSRAGSQIKSFFQRGSSSRSTMPEKIRKSQADVSDSSPGDEKPAMAVGRRNFSDVGTLQDAVNALQFTDDRLVGLERENKKLKKIVRSLQHALANAEPYDRKMYHYYTNV